MKNTLSILLLVQRELRQFYASDKDSQALSELSELIKSTEQETPIETPWDFVEKYYPKYYSSDTIAYADDLQKIIDGEMEDGSEAKRLFEEKFGSSTVITQYEYDRIHKEIYEAAIEGYINSLKK